MLHDNSSPETSSRLLKFPLLLWLPKENLQRIQAAQSDRGRWSNFVYETNVYCWTNAALVSPGIFWITYHHIYLLALKAATLAMASCYFLLSAGFDSDTSTEQILVTQYSACACAIMSMASCEWFLLVRWLYIQPWIKSAREGYELPESYVLEHLSSADSRDNSGSPSTQKYRERLAIMLSIPAALSLWRCVQKNIKQN